MELPDSFDTRRLADKHYAIAPDGSEVRVLCRVTAGSMAHFTLPPRAVSKAMAHRDVEEIWYFFPVTAGCGDASAPMRLKSKSGPVHPSPFRSEHTSSSAVTATSRSGP